jgi:para-aminobenzoate synthetase / 4-amino-4-deoxychorismate lyase
VAVVLGDVALEGSRWKIGPMSFSEPARILIALDVADVEGCLRSASAAAESGSWVVGFISYEASSGFDPRMATPRRSDLPLAWFGIYESPGQRETRYQTCEVGPWEPTMSAADHAAAVSAIRERIERGDTYQANLTFAMDADLVGRPVDLFRRMVRSQRDSYSTFVDLGTRQVLSISPELFLGGSGRRVTTRPMKGTAPRGRSAREDSDRMQELMASEKERAGNVMIVDLLRNDLGRVSEPGSVSVDHLFSAERHPTVWQLTSTVEATLRDDVDLFELLSATFPSGSVTGAPKLSTMAIIAQLETVPRGVYTGAIGYIAPGGNDFEFSVAIRTGVVEDGRIRYHVGGGITYDSMAGAEYEECLWKALAVTGESAVPALLETMLYTPGQGIDLLQGHLERLASSAAYWGIPLDLSSVGEALSAVGGHQEQRVRLILMPGGEIEVELHEPDATSEPVELRVAPHRIDPSDPLWFHKTLDRARYPEPDGDHEVVLVNLDGEVTETNISNLMARFGDIWVTPPVDSGCLSGVYRQKMIDAGDVTERILTFDDLKAADEIAVTNAVRGWRKAVLTAD